MQTGAGRSGGAGSELDATAADPAGFARLLGDALAALARWEGAWPPFDRDPALAVPDRQIADALHELVERLTDNYPFFHPAYAGQMLKPPHPVAALAYAVAQRINPNNHALDGGPATAKLELEVVAQLAELFGYQTHLGHLTSSGTIANLEALWVARELRPGTSVAYSAQAHYTHARMCQVLGVEGIAVPVDRQGRMDLDALEARLRDGGVGTVVATLGTTSLGAVDRLDAIVPLARRYGARVHVDAAYGGFFRLLAADDDDLATEDAAAFWAIAESDSVVVDPHKHGLQPYGCGSMLFRDPAVGRLYRHDSPYTYFTSADLHLGEISLECSRAGAAAAALWTTLRCFPLATGSGLGPVLRRTRRAALRWAELIRGDDRLRLVVEPSLDIIGFYAATPDRRVSSISALTQRVFEAGMTDRGQPLYLAKLNVDPPLLADHDLLWDQPTVTVFRSVLMKPEHLEMVPTLHRRLVELIASVDRA
jgi:glutamate/tyrosine decarboxylase-like PLP-dependent enzyme